MLPPIIVRMLILHTFQVQDLSGLQIRAWLTIYLLAVLKLVCYFTYQCRFTQGNDCISDLKSFFCLAISRHLLHNFSFGDKDLDLRKCNPLHLRAVLEDERFAKCQLVLLHASYPFSKEASYLASVYSQVGASSLYNYFLILFTLC